MAYPATDIPNESGQNIDELIGLLSMHADTEMHEMLMKYYWNIYFGKDVYEVDLDEILDLFDTKLMTNISGMSGGNLLKQYIHYFENSGGAPTNADGTMYIIETDGKGHPTVGYGIDIENSGFKQLFIDAGYPTEVGGEVPVEFVDSLEDMEIENCMTTIRSAAAGLDLKEYQIHALVSRAYNAGTGSLNSSLSPGALGIRNGKNFVQAYQAYWNEEKDNLYETDATTGNFSHQMYTTYMNKPDTSNGQYVKGLEERRKSEWTLFQTGYYDVLGKKYQEGGAIIDAADMIHKYMEQNHYTYCVYFGNSSEECTSKSQCGLNTSFEASKTGKHHTCCATYVSWVLIEAGYLDVSECEHSANGLRDYLKNSKGWTLVASTNDLQPGDILCYNHHVEIFAGEGTRYNAGSGGSIRGASPTTQGRDMSTMMFALRAPN